MTAIVTDETSSGAALPSHRLTVPALAVGAFAVGTSEFMISALLRDVAADLNVSIPMAALLVTGYAMAVAIGGPLMTAATGRLHRTVQITSLLVLFVAGNLICALSTTYEMLMIGRVVGALCHGAFYGAASVTAAMAVPAGSRARALAVVSAGVMVANVVGVPAGTALGQLFGWRTAFWAVSALGACAALALAMLVPRSPKLEVFRLSSEVRALVRPRVLFALSISLCFTIGLFCCFPYLVPLLTSVSGARPAEVPLLLLVFGLGATVGVLGGGYLADRGLQRALVVAFCAQVAVYAAIVLCSGNLTAMWFAVFALGIASMAAVAPLRMAVLNAASDAPALASTMTSSAFNLGVAIGAAAGSAMLELGFDYATLPLMAAALAAVALLLVSSLRATRFSVAPFQPGAPATGSSR